jgi:hypothetical protein
MDLSDVLGSTIPVIPEMLAAKMSRRSSIFQWPSLFEWRRKNESDRSAVRLMNNNPITQTQHSRIRSATSGIMQRLRSSFNLGKSEGEIQPPIVGIVPPRAEIELIRDFYHNKKGLPNEFCSKVRHIRFKNTLNFH